MRVVGLSVEAGLGKKRSLGDENGLNVCVERVGPV